MRIVRGLAALATLLAGLVGVPWLLVTLSRQLRPVLAPWADPAALLTGPDPAAILIALLLGVAWVAWLIFTLGVVSELIDLVSGFRIRLTVPGLASTQRLAAGLLVSVIAMVGTTQASSAGPAPSQALAAAPAPKTVDRAAIDGQRAVTPSGTGAAVAAKPAVAAVRLDDDSHIHVVEQGDDLWSLAQHYYGRGSDWRRIAAANPGRLTGGADRLLVGWRLRIPGVERESADRDSADRDSADRDSADRDHRMVCVEPGDTLSAIAERMYGAEKRWPVLWRANRHQLDDPDELRIGMRLVVPVLDRDRSDRGDAPGSESSERAESERAGSESASEAAPRTGAAAAQPSVDPPVRHRPAEPKRAAAPAPPPPPFTSQAPAPEPTVEASEKASEKAPEKANAAAPSSDAPADAIAAGLAAVGALLAASVVAGLGVRRRLQLQTRPIGRRILHPSESARTAEVVLNRRARTLGLRSLDLATRAISARCHAEASPLPCLTVATVADDHLDLHWTRPAPPPPGFSAEGSRWVLAAADVDDLKTVPGLSEAVRPYPALVTLGLDAEQSPVVGDLETLGLLRLHAEDQTLIDSALAAMAVELSFSPWAEEMILTLVGALPSLPDALGKHNVNHTDDVAGLLDRLESRAAVQRQQQAYEFPGQHRVDPDLADPWAPEIVLINRPLEADQDARLQRLLTTGPRVTMAAVLPASPTAAATGSDGWTLTLGRNESRAAMSVLEPIHWTLTPQLLEPPAAEAVLELITTSGSDVTTPAPWWADPDPPRDNVTYLGKRFGGWATHGGSDQLDGDQLGEAEQMSWGAGQDEEDLVLHPTLRLLGPIELVGAAGPVPARAARQCLEYCGWLLENPGATARAMAASLVVAEGTRRSNMSRLRVWLGEAEDGSPYLPDAYSGRIYLHDAVSSDWQRLQIFTAGGVNLARTSGLRAALHLVRGAPLADAAPGQWYWAEELRTDMISAIRDIGVELTTRALDDNDIDLARWAAARALAAAPGDELLLVARIRTEHQAGHRGEVERLTLQLAGQARQLGIDLAPETVSLLQEVMEGRVRARMA